MKKLKIEKNTLFKEDVKNHSGKYKVLSSVEKEKIKGNKNLEEEISKLDEPEIDIEM